MLLTDRAPVRFEAKTTVIMAESIEEMPALEVENAVITLLVMDRGRIVALGTHDELMAAGGLYERFVRQQLAPSVAKVVA